jgi:hypothetical protein
LDERNKGELTDHPTLLTWIDMTQEKWDSGNGSVTHRGSADLTGKLCWCVMALICWKVGADKAVMEHMVQALEEWLCRRGISIYIDLL